MRLDRTRLLPWKLSPVGCPNFGIIKRLDRATSSEPGVFSVYWAGQNMAHRLPTVEHLRENLGATELELSDADLDRLNRLA